MIHFVRWKRSFFLAVLLSLPLLLTAQELYSLDECLSLVLEQNDKFKISKAVSEITGIQYKQSKGVFIPSLAISNQHNISIGRVLDPTTYDFVENRTVYDMNASIVGSATLFSGLERYHNVEKSRLNNVSSQLSFEETKLELGIDVMTLYFQILLDKATISICENKINLLCKQKEQISKRVEYKAAVPADLLNVKADITNANVELVDATGKLQSDIVSLCSLLGIDDWRTFDVTTIEMDADNSTFTDLILSENFDVIVSKLPSVKQSHVKSDIAMTDIKIASASYWPSIRLDAGFGATFSNARSKFTGEDYSFGEQFRDNVSSYLSMTVSIPILSNVSTSRSVREKNLVIHVQNTNKRKTGTCGQKK